MPSEEVINYQNVTLKFEEQTILSEVTFAVSRGEFIFLLGRVGSGKSSLLKSLYGDMDVANGRANVLGYEMRTIRNGDIPKLRRRMGIVFQDYRLLADRNVEENLRFVLEATGWRDKKEITLHIEEVLSQVGMEKKMYKYPHQLSGGEQQRIVIARALLNVPDIILADEPTGNLDYDNGCEIMKLLYDIHKAGIAILISTHNRNWVDLYPARQLRFESGHILDSIVSNSI